MIRTRAPSLTAVSSVIPSFSELGGREMMEKKKKQKTLLTGKQCLRLDNWG